jgi:hypothetical protein
MKYSIVVFTLLIAACSVSSVNYQEGSVLAKKYCASCHLFTEPGLLPGSVWKEGVLPEMGLRLGMGDRNVLLQKISFKDFDILCGLGVYPDTPLMSQEEWKRIVAYYMKNAPVQPIQPILKSAIEKDTLFFTHTYGERHSPSSTQTTMIKLNDVTHEIWVGDRNRQLDIYSNRGKWKKSIRTPSAVVDAIFNSGTTLLGIGNLQPNEDQNGRLFSLQPLSNNMEMIADSLHRPAEIKEVELNGDGIPDIVIAEFGYITGQIRCIDGATKSQTVISTQPGARNVVIKDENNDGRMDLYVLFTQAWEGVTLFTNRGDYLFDQKKLVSFHPAYGASYLAMDDMDGDGDLDMVVTNGDNADYSMVPKDFHGVHLFSNENGAYHERFFYPVFGATKTIVNDFDKDGDADMAMIAFFSPDQSGENFLFFKQVSPFQFKVSTQGVPPASWLVMDAGDMDRDGDIDIMLASFQEGKAATGEKQHSPSLLLMQNRCADK